MAVVEVLMPKMGESITDATIIKWHKTQGEIIIDEETLLEVATDKVDSEIPSPASGIVKEIFYKEEDVVNVGEIIALIETNGNSSAKEEKTPKKSEVKTIDKISKEVSSEKDNITQPPKLSKKKDKQSSELTSKFYSPLVKSIITKEEISSSELDAISGSGANGRITKQDIFAFLSNRGKLPISEKAKIVLPVAEEAPQSEQPAEPNDSIKTAAGDEIIVMDRMRKLIADHMVQSKRTSAHVTSFAEADVTRMSEWRNRVKSSFLDKYGARLTFTPIMIEIVAKALRAHPRLNASVNEDKIIVKRDINIGMATALPSGNLIVPVIHNADQYNLNGLASKVNDRVEKARGNNLDISDIQNGTFTLTNIGTYGSQLGTPIINQPQVAILATGAIKKKPVVIESPGGDAIAIRQMMYLSMSYDHRVIDGYLGGTFLQTVVKLLENFDDTREI
ncbi:MAG: dihydrolipoamide acetyltransferase family protein [Saprospiraceae bacterium]|nr:dihydrolipoamide acetyltransferase family protein [Saprospiraceae bacterium]|tara:strand:- start:689 stop:2035 length:1347 start_codon:yes stop_codon:yes gene_type:complete